MQINHWPITRTPFFSSPISGCTSSTLLIRLTSTCGVRLAFVWGRHRWPPFWRQTTILNFVPTRHFFFWNCILNFFLKKMKLLFVEITKMLWTCELCTFANRQELAICEMCSVGCRASPTKSVLESWGASFYHFRLLLVSTKSNETTFCLRLLHVAQMRSVSRAINAPMPIFQWQVRVMHAVNHLLNRRCTLALWRHHLANPADRPRFLPTRKRRVMRHYFEWTELRNSPPMPINFLLLYLKLLPWYGKNVMFCMSINSVV